MKAKMGCKRLSGTAVAYSFTSTLDAAFGPRSAALPSGKNLFTHCTGGRVAF
jgi:hypothetical protein